MFKKHNTKENYKKKKLKILLGFFMYKFTLNNADLFRI